MSFKPEVIKYGILSTQVCVPSTFTDEQVLRFANDTNPAGTENGWQIRREGDAFFISPERRPCDEREGCVHIMLDC